MFITQALFDPVVKRIDINDKDFWMKSLEYAKNWYESSYDDSKMTVKQIKMNTPAFYSSQLYNDKSIGFERKQYNVVMKAHRRKSIVLDFDCETKQEYDLYQTKLKNFSKMHDSYLMMYPTVSYPDKPHFRAVILTKTGLNPVKYAECVSWIYDSIGLPITDESDLDIRASRNLPIFINDEQIDAIYSNFEEDHQLLDSKTWKDFKIDKQLKAKINRRIKTASEPNTQLEDSDVKYVKDKLIKCFKEYVGNNKNELIEYYASWRLLTSIAKSYCSGMIDWETTQELSNILASISKEHEDEWRANNIKAIQSACQSPDDLVKAYDLYEYDSKLLFCMKRNMTSDENKEDKKSDKGDEESVR